MDSFWAFICAYSSFWASLTRASFFGAFDNLMAKNTVQERGKNADKMLTMLDNSLGFETQTV